MAYTYTLPTLKLPSGDVILSFYSNTTSTAPTNNSHTYILSLSEINKEVDLKGGELILSSLDLEIWDRDGNFRYYILNDLTTGFTIKVTLTVNGTTEFIGIIDKYTISTEQRYGTISSGEIGYAFDSDGFSYPIEVIKFTIKDVLSLLEDVSIKSLEQKIETYLSPNTSPYNNWIYHNGRTFNSNDTPIITFWLIPIKQLLRDMFTLSPISDVIKIGVQVQDNFLGLMSHDAVSSASSAFSYSLANNTNHNNVFVDKAKDLDDLYLLYNRSNVFGKGNFFRSEEYSADNTSTNAPTESIYNFNNCLELLSKIVYTFGLVIYPRYNKKSIFSVSITNAGYDYTNGNIIPCALNGGGGSGAELYFADFSGSVGTIDTSIIKYNGVNYTTAPTIIIDPPSVSNRATASANLNSGLTRVETIYVSSGGSGYYTAPNVTITAPPPTSVAQFSAVIESGVVTDVNIINGGSGYRTDNLPNIEISSPYLPPKTGAVLSIQSGDITNGVITNVTIDSGGGGYDWTNPPAITIDSPPNAVQATANAVIAGGSVVAVTPVEKGSGYTTAPTITINPPNLSNQAEASCSLSDFDIYLTKRDSGELLSSSDIIESNIENTSDTYLDEYEISTLGYSQYTHDTTSVKLKEFPKQKHSGSTIFGLLNDNGAFSSYSDNYLLGEAQYNSVGSTTIGENKYTIARFIHDNENLITNHTLATNANGWAITGGTSYTTGGVFSGTGYIQLSANSGIAPTEPLSDYVVGNLNKTIKGKTIVVSMWCKEDTINENVDSLFVQPLDSAGDTIEFKNKSSKKYKSASDMFSESYKFFAFELTPLNTNAEISKIKIYFGSTITPKEVMISSPKVYVGSEILSRWLTDKYIGAFSSPSSQLTRKYDGLTTTNIKIGDYITDNGQNYYIKKITKNLTDNETEIEAINYTNL